MTPTETWLLPTNHIGRRVSYFERIGSTNSLALSYAADPANDGLAILAGEQTAGRGQHGRSWACPGGSGVLLSLLLFPPPALRRPAILTAWAAVSVCELIRAETGMEAQIKWPNDVLIQGHKVCGILIEQANGTVAGIGLNVNQPAEHFAAAGLPEAASLAVFSPAQRDCRQVANRLIQRLDSEYGLLCKGDLGALEARWQERLGLLNRQVHVETTAGVERGRLCALTFAGVQIATADGQTQWFAPEMVKHLK